ncbi:MAG: CsgG/HfaB family protein [Gemmatimonadota bacterium]|nr:CsgG/HfaB family protein [Gemmatimonadota bacterium]
MKRTIALWPAALAALVISGGRAGAQGDTRPTVAVMYFANGVVGSNTRDYDALGRGVADILVTAMAANPGIRVVERDQIEKVMSEHKLVTEGQVDAGTAIRVGKLLGVHHMIFGAFVGIGESWRLDARAVNVETSAVEHVETVSGKQANLMSMIDQMANRLNTGMKLPPLPAGAREMRGEAAKKVPFQVALQYSRALALKDAGKPDSAAVLLTRSLHDFPDYEPAKRELAKIQTKRGTN